MMPGSGRDILKPNYRFQVIASCPDNPLAIQGEIGRSIKHPHHLISGIRFCLVSHLGQAFRYGERHLPGCGPVQATKERIKPVDFDIDHLVWPR